MCRGAARRARAHLFFCSVVRYAPRSVRSSFFSRCLRSATATGAEEDDAQHLFHLDQGHAVAMHQGVVPLGILAVEQAHAPRGLAVAPGAPHLLHVLLHAARQAGVHNRPHVALAD